MATYDVNPSSVEIPLSQGKIAIVDAEDYELVRGYTWCATHKGNNFYAVTHTSRAGGKKSHSVYLHRLLMNPPRGQEVDHINGDSLDNRRCNLRLATKAQNQHNMRIREGGTSKYKGVQWRKDRHKWGARIHYHGKTIILGVFTDEVVAARAYDAKARELFGEFARCNFPE